MRKIERISIEAADREQLEQLVPPQKVVWRARIVLLAGDGLTAVAIAAAAGKSVLTVRPTPSPAMPTSELPALDIEPTR